MKKEQAKYWLTKGTENKSREKGPGDLVQKKGYGKLGVEKKVGMELLRHTILYEYMFV